MTITELGSLGEVVAAIATVATLAYLAVQIRHSNRSNYLLASVRLSEAIEDWVGKVVCDPALFELYRRGIQDPDALSSPEWRRFEFLLINFMHSLQSASAFRELKLTDTDQWKAIEASIAFVLGSAGGRRVFERNRSFVGPRTAYTIEAILHGKNPLP